MTTRRSDELELFNERAGIREFDGGLSRDIAERLAEEDVEAYRHRCEVASVVRMYKTKGAEAVKKFLLLVEKERGSTAAQRLRNDALKAIKDRK
jgi:hypothetical protein